MKLCAHCRQVKPFGGFAYHKRTKDHRQSWCKACMLAYLKRYVQHEKPPAPVVLHALHVQHVTPHTTPPPYGHQCSVCGQPVEKGHPLHYATGQDRSTPVIRSILEAAAR